MQHPDEGMIHTWLDGELSPEDSTALESHVAECQQCAAAVAEARGFMAGASRIVNALDIIPGGVIPIAKPRQRAWYSTAQFRAAAAVLVVAGASLLVFRNENQKGTPVMQRAASVAEKRATPAVAPTTASASSTSAENNQPKADGSAANLPSPIINAPMAAARIRKAAPAPAVADAAVRKDALTRSKDEDFVGKGVKGGTSYGVAGSGVPQTQGAFAKASAAEEPKASDALKGKVAGVENTARITGTLDHVVVTGVATAPVALAEARLLRVDSTKTPKQSFYETAKGARLVLTELESPDFTGMGVKETASASTDRRTMMRPRSAPTATVLTPPTAPVPDPMIQPPVAAAQASAKPTINTIMWFDATGLRRYVLSGPVSVAELEAVKAQIQRGKQ